MEKIEMGDLQSIIEVLEKSVEKHGEKPLTNIWLLNILKQAERKAIYNDEGYRDCAGEIE